MPRIIDATRYSAQGMRAAYKHEAAFRQNLWMAIIGIPLAFWLAQSTTQILLLILPLMVLVQIELANSAIEAVVDRFGGEHHELSGRAKDMGSAMTMISLIMVFTSWILIVGDNYIW